MTLQEFIYNTSIDPKYYVFLSVQIPDKRLYVHNFKRDAPDGGCY